MLFSAWVSSTAIADNQNEYALKAAYIYNFTKFMDWPNEAFKTSDASLNICIDGELPAKSILTELQSRTTQGRPLRVFAIDDTANIAHCHIIYFRKAAKKQVRRVLTLIGNNPVLTVGEYSGFAEEYGVVEFAVVNGRIRLFINHQRAKSCGIVISAQLLEIASVIEKVEQI
ncbi:MAG: YfiR family protein [Pseudomonadales bacterium]|nr:YfiR family protein [Pseudomonadales bacterium]